MRKIEAGCRAVIVNTKTQNGLEVMVLGAHNGMPDIWDIDKTVMSYFDEQITWANSIHLRRIDDDELGSWDNEVFKNLDWHPNKQLVTD